VSFDPIARHYRWLEAVTFGSTLQQARTRWIETIPPPERALILGEGDGRFLSELLRVHPNVVVDCVDASGRMLDLARKRLVKVVPRAEVNFVREDVLTWAPSGSYDLLVVNFFLDCFPRPELMTVIRKLVDVASGGAYLFFADFSIPKKLIARTHAKIWLAIMYGFFRATTGIAAKRLIDPTSEFEINGFTCLNRAHWRFGLVKSELWQYGP
jgi:ubiquinone/menaquinone biosynthesis C-methylase UbiE